MAGNTEDLGNETSVEDDILSGVEGIEDETSIQESNTEEQTASTDKTTDKNAPGGEVVDKGVEGQSKDKPNTGPQDLVDATGNVIAKGGKERRFYETMQNEKSRADNLQRELATAQIKLEAVEKIGTLDKQYNLSPEQLTTGAQMMAAYIKNPVETIKYLLTQAQASGHNIEGIGTGTDMQSIKQMLTNALKPVTDTHEQSRAITERVEVATQQYNGFISTYPDAAIHEDVIAQLLDKEPNLSLEAAYYKLKSFYSERGLDFTKPLAQLTKEAEERPATTAQGVTESIPSGNVNPNSVVGSDTVADVSTSIDDIIRQSMQEAGLVANG